MALSLHRRDCKASYPEDLRTSDLDERPLPIVASGTSRKFRRQTTGKWEWADAKQTAARWETSGRWDVATAPPAESTQPARPERETVPNATKAFLDKCNNRSIQPGALAKYKTFTNQLDAFALDRGYTYVDQFNVADMDRF